MSASETPNHDHGEGIGLIITIARARADWFWKTLPVCLAIAFGVTVSVLASAFWIYRTEMRAIEIELPPAAVPGIAAYFLGNLFIAQMYSDALWRWGNRNRWRYLVLPFISFMMLLSSGLVIAGTYFVWLDRNSNLDSMYLALNAFYILASFIGVGIISAVIWLIAGWVLSNILSRTPPVRGPDTPSGNAQL